MSARREKRGLFVFSSSELWEGGSQLVMFHGCRTNGPVGNFRIILSCIQDSAKVMQQHRHWVCVVVAGLLWEF